MMLDLDKIQHDPFFDCREELNKEAVRKYTLRFKEYKIAMDNGEVRDYPFKPIKVWHDSSTGQFVRMTGGHRSKSAKNAGLDKIKAIVFCGSKKDALKIALEDNRENAAVELSGGDLKLCIVKCREQFTDITSGVIADMLGCSRQHVDKVIKQFATGCELPVPAKRKGKDGKMYSTSRRESTRKQKNAIEHAKIDSSEEPGSNATLKPTDKVALEKSEGNKTTDQVIESALVEAPEQAVGSSTGDAFLELAEPPSTASDDNGVPDNNVPFTFDNDKEPEQSVEVNEVSSKSDVETVLGWLERIKQMSESFSKKEWQDVQEAMRELRTWFGEQYKKKFNTESKR